MLYRRLGKSVLLVSEFALGSGVTFNKQVHEEDALKLMTTAYDAGINFFDNAEGYEGRKSEALMEGAVIHSSFPAKYSGWKKTHATRSVT